MLAKGDHLVAQTTADMPVHQAQCLGDQDLVLALTTWSAELLTQVGVRHPPTLQVLETGRARALPPHIRDELCFVVCEAVRNAVRHAQARHIEIEVIYGVLDLTLRVRDDGQGIARQALVAAEVGQPAGISPGLQAMRARAQALDARLEVWTGRDAGTEVALRIPRAVAYAVASR